MKREFKIFLQDILNEIFRIKKFTKNLDFKNFKSDEKTIYAVTRSLEIIGEATSQIPIEIRKKYSNINWKEIKGFRDKIVHKYWGVDLEIEWDIIVNELDILKKQIKQIIEKENWKWNYSLEIKKEI